MKWIKLSGGYLPKWKSILSVSLGAIYILSTEDFVRQYLANAGYSLFLLGIQPNFLASIFIMGAGRRQTDNLSYVLIFALIWGIGGEYVQLHTGGVFDYYDMVATILGVVPGWLIFWFKDEKLCNKISICSK